MYGYRARSVNFGCLDFWARAKMGPIDTLELLACVGLAPLYECGVPSFSQWLCGAIANYLILKLGPHLPMQHAVRHQTMPTTQGKKQRNNNKKNFPGVWFVLCYLGYSVSAVWPGQPTGQMQRANSHVMIIMIKNSLLAFLGQKYCVKMCWPVSFFSIS